MKTGKLTNEQLKSIVLSRLHPKGNVLLRSGVGEDCAALDFGGEACVLSTDPITGAVDNIGALAVYISCNDVASSGARPSAMLVTMLIPPDKTLSDIEQVLDQLTSTADSLGVDIIGGHTEITDAVNRIVISTTVIGKVSSDKLVTSSGAKPGDDIIMTGYAAVEGTYIIGAENKKALKAVLTDEDRELLDSLGPKISVVEDGLTAAMIGATAMHDVTEGGAFGAIHELCEASGAGCIIDKEKIPVLDVTKKICEFFNINPYRLIGSGSMLITTRNTENVMEALNAKNIKASLIGRITEKEIIMLSDGKYELIDPPDADELFSL